MRVIQNQPNNQGEEKAARQQGAENQFGKLQIFQGMQ